MLFLLLGRVLRGIEKRLGGIELELREAQGVIRSLLKENKELKNILEELYKFNKERLDADRKRKDTIQRI